MPPISVLIKPSSGNCNLRCAYCFYYDTMEKREKPSYGFMTEQTLEAVLREVLSYAEGSCTIAYQGGEPTLSGLPFFEKSMELQERYNVNHVKIFNAIQTNGYQINQDWAEFFKKHHFLVGVSLDGGPKQHDVYRKTPKGEGSFSQVMKHIELLQKAGVEFNILSVVNGRTAPHIRKNYAFYRKNHLDYLQFIACLDPLGETPGQKEYSLTPEAYGTFLIELFDLWYADLLAGKQPFIRQFENYIAMLLGQMPESCDMRGICGMQYVVEADGAVYPCDFYVLDAYRLGNFLTDSVEVIDRKREEIGFIEESKQKEEACTGCRYEALCRGGCRRNRMEEQGHHQYFCESYQMFFDACLPRMMEIARNLQR
ncbi:MAG: anaerobic sulfatase maturase [Lachnospiraceae bacterium]|nr:anaerobic sulfatase maturase [Lachnospiraceae bacterium]